MSKEVRDETVTLKIKTNAPRGKLDDRFRWQMGADKFVVDADDLIVVEKATVTPSEGEEV